MIVKDKSKMGWRNIITFQDRQLIESMNRDGVLPENIARSIHRASNTIRRELRYVNPYNAEQAQKLADMRRKRKKDAPIELGISSKKSAERLISLEFQLGIAIDLLQEVILLMKASHEKK